MNECEAIIRMVITHYPNTQAIYLFGSHGTKQEWPESDVDIAVLLPPDESKQAGSLAMSKLHITLERLLGKDVDIINLRQVSTVFQKEITLAERRIFCADDYVADGFEMLVLSFYLKLNEERQQILDEFWQTGRAYKV